MEKLKTPFGNIEIRIDGKSVPYMAQKGSALEVLCPNVLGRYQIDVSYIPEGKQHEISCVFSPGCSYKRSTESGENLECQGFYNSQQYKMSIGIEFAMEDFARFDYVGNYLENGMSYLILENTKTNHFVFGISWIDKAGWQDSSDEAISRNTETWYGADPSFSL